MYIKSLLIIICVAVGTLVITDLVWQQPIKTYPPLWEMDNVRRAIEDHLAGNTEASTDPSAAPPILIHQFSDSQLKDSLETLNEVIARLEEGRSPPPESGFDYKAILVTVATTTVTTMLTDLGKKLTAKFKVFLNRIFKAKKRR